LADCYQTTADGFAVDKDRTCPAVSGVATYFGSGEAEVFTQYSREALLGPRDDGNFTVVDL